MRLSPVRLRGVVLRPHRVRLRRELGEGRRVQAQRHLRKVTTVEVSGLLPISPIVQTRYTEFVPKMNAIVGN